MRTVNIVRTENENEKLSSYFLSHKGSCGFLKLFDMVSYDLTKKLTSDSLDIH